MDFKAALETFLSHLKLAREASEHTLRAYQLDLFAFAAFAKVEGIEQVEGISKRIVRRYLAHLHEKQARTRTILRRLSSLKSFFKFAMREKLVTENPLEEIESPKKEKRLPISISYEQVEVLFSQPDLSGHLGVRDRAIMELFYSSGLRLSELANLKRADFNAKELVLNIFGKGKKQRQAPITKNAADWVLKYLDHPERKEIEKDPESIFLNKCGTKLTPRSIDRNFSRYLKASGL